MPNLDQKQKLLTFAREMRKSPSEAENKLWQSLRRNQLDGLYFRRQKPIGPFIVDFACADCMLIVEVDGSQHGDAGDYDRRRTAMLNELGWRVIRFAAWDVVGDVDAVLNTILREAKGDSPIGRPPP